MTPQPSPLSFLVPSRFLRPLYSSVRTANGRMLSFTFYLGSMTVLAATVLSGQLGLASQTHARESTVAGAAASPVNGMFVSTAEDESAGLQVQEKSARKKRSKSQSKATQGKSTRTKSSPSKATEQAGNNASVPKEEPSPQFIRLQKKDGEPQFLQTAIVSYRPRPQAEKSAVNGSERKPATENKLPPALRVDLVGVIHIAERSYYEELNKRLHQYDVVLYELVAPEGTRVTPGTRSAHPVSIIQRSMTDFLGLVFQLDAIDYQRPNFVHADMSPEEFTRSMEEKGENLWTMFFRAFGYEFARSQARQSGSNDLDFLRALFSKDRQLEMKRLFAEQLAEDVEGQIRALEGPQGSPLISGRNEKVLEVLREQIAQGHRRIAIFYGAGHMYHFHERLVELGLVPVKTKWLNAWDLREPSGTVED